MSASTLENFVDELPKTLWELGNSNLDLSEVRVFVIYLFYIRLSGGSQVIMRFLLRRGTKAKVSPRSPELPSLIKEPVRLSPRCGPS